MDMAMMPIKNMFNSCLSGQSGSGVELGHLRSHFQSIPKWYQKVIVGVFTITNTKNFPITCCRFPSPTVCSIHSSSSHHQARSSKSRRSQFYQEELGSKKDQDKHFLPNHLSETHQEQGEGDQVLHCNSSIQPNRILDESHRSYDFLHEPQFDNSSNNTDKLGLDMERQDRNRGPTLEAGGKEEEGKPISKAENLLMNISRIQKEQKEERLRLEKGRPRRQMMKRSTLIAKQVISIQSAVTLGFVSQLWVDTTCWTVLIVEVRPNLLSGEVEKFFLEDIAKVGDVVLTEDESVLENDFKLLGLETLVGYTVISPSQGSIGKVRGYSFDINSGAVESLELDSFGISIIPSSLVSTYSLFVEDVREVSGERVVVDEAAASRIQRLTKGIWNASKEDEKEKKMKQRAKKKKKRYKDGDEEEREWDDDNNNNNNNGESRKTDELLSSSSRRRRKEFGGRGEMVEWELPLDYI